MEAGHDRAPQALQQRSTTRALEAVDLESTNLVQGGDGCLGVEEAHSQTVCPGRGPAQ